MLSPDEERGLRELLGIVQHTPALISGAGPTLRWEAALQRLLAQAARPAVTSSGGVLLPVYLAANEPGATELAPGAIYVVSDGTVGEQYKGVESLAGGTPTAKILLMLNKWLVGSKTYNWPAIADSASATTTVTVTGAALGDFAVASMDVAMLAGWIIGATVSAADTVQVTLYNRTGASKDLASGTLTAAVFS